ncbi:MAG: DUF1573 domain-containing protein [Pirellulales bacterium]|nr:DUF1573 domain-containing protein [Pirellulales bacterium]
MEEKPVPALYPDSETSPAAPGAAVARAHVDRLRHDFGVIDADKDYEHIFHITNKGQSKLELRSGEASCKCILSKLPVRVLDPGESTTVRIVAKTRNKSGPFNDRVEIHTNDPQRELLTFQISGTIRKFLGCDPPRVQWSNLNCSQDHTAEVLVYSQVWKDFDLNSVEPSLDGIRWEILPAPAKRLASLSAESGHLLKVTLPAETIRPTDSSFHASLHLRATVHDKDNSSRSGMLVLAGSVARQARFFGRKIDGRGVLRLGTVAAGESTRERVIVRLKKTNPPVSISSLETKPDFLKARIDSSGDKTSSAGVIWLEVEIPADAPLCRHFGRSKGSICMKTDDPDIPAITLDVEFAVLDNIL